MKFPERSDLGSKNILKIKPGESVVGVFRGEIYTFRQHWANNRSTLCHGSSECERCQKGEKSSYRFQLNFVMKENAALVAKVFEQGWTVQQQLEELNKDYPLENYFIKITRQGNGTDTTYTILPSKAGALTKALEAEISKIPLNALDPASVAGAKEAASATDGPDDDEDKIPF